jgi:hypothetical protein
MSQDVTPLPTTATAASASATLSDANNDSVNTTTTTTSHMIDFLTAARGLKTTLRTGWVRQQANDRIESVADHS